MPRTVTFSKLGDWGQFGNQLFQIAAVLGYAERHGARPCLPRWRCHMTGWDYEADFPAIAAYQGGFPDGALHAEPSFAYAEIPASENLDLRGNFQCERYFAHCAPMIRRLFAEPAALTPSLDRFQRAHGLADFSAMHLRFYAHPTRDKGKGPMEALPLGYYSRAFAALGADLPVIVTSDSPRLLAAALDIIQPAARIIRSDLDSHLLDFFLLSRARRLAISNSSFSWWAAWLGAPKERVIAPHRYFWFNPAVRHDPFWDTRDLYPAHFAELAW